MTDQKAFGDRLKKVIEKRGISKYRLSKDTGVNQTTLANYINGTIDNPQQAIIKSLADYFHVSVDWLAKGELSPGSTDPLDRDYFGVFVDESILGDDKRMAVLGRFLNKFHEELSKHEVYLTYLDKVIEIETQKKEIREIRGLRNEGENSGQS